MAQTDEKRAFAQRLREALLAQGLQPSPTRVANAFNLRHWGRSITPHTARNWLLGKALPTQDKLRTLADWLQVSPEALRFGGLHAARGVADTTLAPALNLVDQEMLARYQALPPPERRLVCEVVAALAVAAAHKAMNMNPPETHGNRP